MKNDIRMRNFKDYVGELRAVYRRTSLPTVKINSSKTVRNFIYSFYDEIMDDHEEFKVIHLNNNNNVVNIHHVSSGTDRATVVCVKDIMRQALLIKTTGIIIVHNHPSGNLTPSEADKNITAKIAEAGKILDVKLLDSIIITRESHFSFADNNLM